jgi:hypothetical protein
LSQNFFFKRSFCESNLNLFFNKISFILLFFNFNNCFNAFDNLLNENQIKSFQKIFFFKSQIINDLIVMKRDSNRNSTQIQSFEIIGQ